MHGCFFFSNKIKKVLFIVNFIHQYQYLHHFVWVHDSLLIFVITVCHLYVSLKHTDYLLLQIRNLKSIFMQAI